MMKENSLLAWNCCFFKTKTGIMKPYLSLPICLLLSTLFFVQTAIAPIRGSAIRVIKQHNCNPGNTILATCSSNPATSVKIYTFTRF
jgi:hypothetical protein